MYEQRMDCDYDKGKNKSSSSTGLKPKGVSMKYLLFWGGVMMLNAIFNNISAISWRSVSLVEETGETATMLQVTDKLQSNLSYVTFQGNSEIWSHKAGGRLKQV